MDDTTISAHKVIITVGILMFIFGFFGNVMNICVFLSWYRVRKQGNEVVNNHRTSNSTLYLLISSWANLILIIYPLLTRIVFDGFQYPKTVDNELFTCKLRFYVLHTFDLISLTCICLATLDRYLISSRDVHLRQRSPTLRRTKQIILLLISLISLHSIPIAVYYEISDFGDCIISSSLYSYYYLSVIQIVLHSILPVVFLSIFGTLTYRQLRTTLRNAVQNNRNVDRQLSRMLFLSCLSISISSVPYCIENVYTIGFRASDQPRVSLSLLFYFLSVILFFANPAFSFYIFFISTPNFRQQTKKILQCKSMATMPNNQVHTIRSLPNV